MKNSTLQASAHAQSQPHEIRASVADELLEQNISEIEALNEENEIRNYLRDAFFDIISKKEIGKLTYLKKLTEKCFDHIAKLKPGSDNVVGRHRENILKLLTITGQQKTDDKLDFLYMTLSYIRIRKEYKEQLDAMECSEWIKYFDRKQRKWAEGTVDFKLIKEEDDPYRFVSLNSINMEASSSTGNTKKENKASTQTVQSSDSKQVPRTEEDLTSTRNKTTKKRAHLKIDKKYEDKISELVKETRLILGSASEDGDCFFDSVAQVLSDQNVFIPEDIDEPTTDACKRLEVLCNKYMKSGMTNKDWVTKALDKDAKTTSQSYTGRLKSVRFRQSKGKRIDKKNPLNFLSLQERYSIQGRIICEKLNIKLHVIELHTDTGTMVPCHFLINGSEYKTVRSNEVRYDDPNVVHIMLSNYHFVPLLNIGINKKKLESKRISLTETKPLIGAHNNPKMFDEKRFEEQYKSLQATYRTHSNRLQMVEDKTYQQLLNTSSIKVFQFIISEPSFDSSSRFELMNASFSHLPDLTVNEKIKIVDIYLTESVNGLFLNTTTFRNKTLVDKGCLWIFSQLLQRNIQSTFQWLEDWLTKIQKQNSKKIFCATDCALQILENFSSLNSTAVSYIRLLRGRNYLAYEQITEARDCFNKIAIEHYSSLSTPNLEIIANFYLKYGTDQELELIIPVFLFNLPNTLEINTLAYKLLLHDYELIEGDKELPYDDEDFNELAALWIRDPILRDHIQINLAHKLIDRTFSGESIATTILTNNIASQIYSQKVIKEIKEYIYWISIKRNNADREVPNNLVSQNAYSIVLLLRGIFYYSENPPRYQDAIQAFESAIELNNIEAMRWRAIMYKEGLGSATNFEAAKALYERAKASLLSIKDENQRQLKQLNSKTVHDDCYSLNLDNSAYFNELGFSISKKLVMTKKLSPKSLMSEIKLLSEDAVEKLIDNEHKDAAYYCRCLEITYHNNIRHQKNYQILREKLSTILKRRIAEKQEHGAYENVYSVYDGFLYFNWKDKFKELLNENIARVLKLTLQDPLLSPKQTALLIQENCDNYGELSVAYLEYLLTYLNTHGNKINNQRWLKSWFHWFVEKLLNDPARANYLEDWFNQYYSDFSNITENEHRGVHARVAAILFKPLTTLITRAKEFVNQRNLYLCHALLGRIALRFNPDKASDHFNTAQIPLNYYTTLSFETLSVIAHHHLFITKTNAEFPKTHPAINAILICCHLKYRDDILMNIVFKLLRRSNGETCVDAMFDEKLFEQLQKTYLDKNKQLRDDLELIKQSFHGTLSDVFSGDIKQTQQLQERLLQKQLTTKDKDFLTFKKYIKELTESKEASDRYNKKAKGVAWMLQGFLYVNSLDGPVYHLVSGRGLTQTELDIQRYQAAKKAYSEAIKLGNSEAYELLEMLLLEKPHEDEDAQFYDLLFSNPTLKPTFAKVVPTDNIKGLDDVDSKETSQSDVINVPISQLQAQTIFASSGGDTTQSNSNSQEQTDSSFTPPVGAVSKNK